MKNTKNVRWCILALAICSAIFVTACSENNAQAYVPPAPITKKITLKASPTEQRMSFDIWDKQSLRRRATTVYYLVAEDGTAVEVGLSDYAKAKEGEPWSATPNAWKKIP